jgi:hypothetical protein
MARKDVAPLAFICSLLTELRQRSFVGARGAAVHGAGTWQVSAAFEGIAQDMPMGWSLCPTLCEL